MAISRPGRGGNRTDCPKALIVRDFSSVDSRSRPIYPLVNRLISRFLEFPPFQAAVVDRCATDRRRSRISVAKPSRRKITRRIKNKNKTSLVDLRDRFTRRCPMSVQYRRLAPPF
jgi:hypothetical protein